MGVDIGVTTEEFVGNEDRRWLGTRMGTQDLRSITLDVSAFEAGHFTEKGAIPSGTLLGKITASGKYGPYGQSANEVQTVAIDGTGGTYALTFDGETTATLTYLNTSGDTAVILAALEALSNINPGDVTVTRGTPAGTSTTFTVTFKGQYSGQNVPQMTSTETLTGGAGTITHATTQAGGSTVSDGTEEAAGILFTTTQVGKAGDGSDFATASDVGAALFWTGVVKTAFLPVFSGTNKGELDDEARETLSMIRWED